MNIVKVHQSIATYLREALPDARWDEIDDLKRALTHELFSGPMPYGYWNDKHGGDALCVTWTSFGDACKELSAILAEDLPNDCWYDNESGDIMLSDPYQDDAYWEADPEAPVWGDGTYVGPTDVYNVPTLEALTNEKLWRYLT